MTREEAIQVLKMVEAHGLADEAKRMAIEALSAPKTDLIRRADALRELNGACSNWEDDSRVQEIVMALPSANVIEFDFNKYQPRVWNKVNDGTPSADAVQGEWIDMEIHCNPYPPIFCVECSRCGYRVGRETFLENTFNFCPSCGARMKGGDDE